MANNTHNHKSKSETEAKLYWFFTAFMLLAATPIGIIMIVAKLLETKQQGKPQVAPDTPVGARTTAGSSAQHAKKRTIKGALSPLAKKAKKRIQLAGVLTAISLLALVGVMGEAFPFLPGNPMWFLEEIWFPLCCTTASGVYLLSGLRLRKNVRRYRNYLSVIGSRRTMPVATLSSATNIPSDKIRADLEEMLDTGILAEGFLDYQNDRLILSSEGLDDPSPAKKPEKAASPDAAVQENALLAEIKSVNDLIKNETLSAQIDRIGIITAKILDYGKSHPQKSPQLHSFLSYYLPTTLKILRAYAQLEAQDVSGENITAAMKRIEDMMDKVVEGFEKQLDQLFLGDTMDITSDVEVLERMLAKDGLSGQDLTLNL